jgi:TetR/AcrR family transcriptional regulator, cholesterol catabolism regulator
MTDRRGHTTDRRQDVPPNGTWRQSKPSAKEAPSENRLGPVPAPTDVSPFGRSLDTSGRKRLLLDAAAQLFERNGYHGTSMQDISSAVGITKSALYHYVDSKEQLVYEIHDAFVSTMIEEADEYLPTTQDPVVQLKFIVESIFRAIADYRPYVRAFFQDMRSLERADWYRLVVEKRNYYESLVSDCLARGQVEGKFDFPVGPILASRFLFGACNWAYQWLDPEGDITPAELSDQWCEMLLKAFSPRVTSDAAQPAVPPGTA